MERRRLRKIIGWALAANLIIGFVVYAVASSCGGASGLMPGLGRLIRVMQLVRRNYVDERRTSPADLLNAAINGMMRSLDEWSAYMPPEAAREWEDEGAGHYGGIGITFFPDASRLVVRGVIPNGPAQRAGLKTGDEILTIDGAEIDDSDFANGFLRLRGEPGTKVTIGVKRGEEEMELTLTREVINMPVVRNRFILEGDIGFIQLLEFADSSVPALEDALKYFEKQKVKGLVIDLRSNPGGNVDTAVDICSMFLEENQVVVTMKGRVSRGAVTHFSHAGYHFPSEIPLVLLVNGATASSAEIMSGCLQDHGRAMLVGTRTFGKGVAQSFFPLGDGTAVKLTTSRFYTPDSSKGSIHGNGIAPDYEVKISRFRARRLEDSYVTGEEPQLKLDPQLAKAVEIISNSSHSGGGAQK